MDGDTENFVIDIIINTFMDNPDLFDKSDPEYVDRYGKKSKLEHIVLYLKEMGIDISVSDIIKTWKSLVTKFKQCLKEENTYATGSAATASTFPYFQEMMFLKPSLQHMTPLSSLTPQVHNAGDKKRKSKETSTISSPNVPELDNYAKKKVKAMIQEDVEVSEVTSEMMKILQAVQNKFNLQVPETSVGYTSILTQAFQEVPAGYENECLMHVLNDLEQFDKENSISHN